MDGRLKGYPKYSPMSGAPNEFYFRMVRGNTSYGVNDLIDNGDGTISDNATGLMWQQADNGTTYNWENALSYAEDFNFAGHSDWRLPNAKELQSIVDYTRSPNTTASPAIDPLFFCTSITDPNGNSGQYGYYWSSSPLQDGPQPYSDAVYFCFGRALGRMELPPNSGNYQLLDVHGAGAQRNDPKTGDPSNFPDYFGPQGDARYVFNFVRCVRDISSASSINDSDLEKDIKIYPSPSSVFLVVEKSSQFNITKIEITNVNGQLIKSITDAYLKITIYISTFDAGIYFLRIYTDGGSVSRKFVVE